MTLSSNVKVVHVDNGESAPLDTVWERMVQDPLSERDLPEPELITVKSSFRTVVSPLMDVVLRLEEENPSVKIAVLLPELVLRHWWEYPLHNHRVQLLKLLLLLKGKQRIVVINIPWYLSASADPPSEVRTQADGVEEQLRVTA